MKTRHVWTKRQLERFAEISEIWEQRSHAGVPNKRIYKQHIEPKYGVGMSTFYRALHVPAKRLLREMGEKDVMVTDENFNKVN